MESIDDVVSQDEYNAYLEATAWIDDEAKAWREHKEKCVCSCVCDLKWPWMADFRPKLKSLKDLCQN